MARKAASKAASNGQPPNLEQLSFDRSNEPNADVLLPSLRSSGYSLETATGDIFDNSIDGDASEVGVNLAVDKKKEEWELEVVDNGVGMDEPVLDQMMRLGSRSDHDLDRDLGAFGLGSDTAALGIGRNKHVITSPEPGVYLSAMWDLDVIVAERKFVKHLDQATPEEVELYEAAYERASFAVPDTGTVVRITRCDRINRKDLNSAKGAVIKYIGQTYRRFLVPNGGLVACVNGDKVEPIDPMMRDHPETLVLLDDQAEFSWKADDGRHSDTFGLFVVHLPDLGGKEANKDAGIRPDTSGYYVLRNGREIVAHTTLRQFTQHAEFARFRCEVTVPATMDPQLGVTFLKSSLEVKPTQGLSHKIEQLTAPYRRQSRKLYLKSRKDAPEQVPHDEAAKQIKSRSPFLRKPKAEIEKRGPRKKSSSNSKQTKESERTRSPRDRAQKALADEATFEAKALGPTAPFYEGTLIGRRILITYNSDHPGYQRLILDNRDNRGQITGIDFLVWSIVAAELRNWDDSTARFMEGMREDASFNLRQLLTV
jgi:Histidine kinase-, DNA gyrase B-, and HSP90-like ATPase